MFYLDITEHILYSKNSLPHQSQIHAVPKLLCTNFVENLVLVLQDSGELENHQVKFQAGMEDMLFQFRVRLYNTVPIGVTDYAKLLGNFET